MKVYEINGEKVVIEIRRYSSNNSLALILNTVKGEQYAVLSVNIADSDYNKENECFVDVNNCPWALEFIEKYNLAIFSGLGESGFCIYPLYDFSEFVNKYFKELTEEIRMPGNPRFYKIYQTGLNSYNFEITRAEQHINITTTTEQMNKLQGVLDTYLYEDLSDEETDEDE